MKPTKRIRPKIGDLCRIATPAGFGYFQYTHNHEVYGHLIRVLPGLYPDEPNLEDLIKSNAIYSIFFPLGAACNRKIVELIAEARIKPAWAKFPLFRSGVADEKGDVKVWWIWDGEKEWRVESLTTEEATYPIRSICNDTFLIDELLKINGSERV